MTLQERLEKINDALCSEYECRRRMLMKRLDVTVQSFGWSDRAKVNLMYFLLPVGGSLLQFPNSSYRICIPCKYTNKLPSLLSFLQPVSHPKYPSSCNIQILGIEEGDDLTRWHSPSFVTIYSFTIRNSSILCWGFSLYLKFPSPCFLFCIEHPSMK